MDEEAKAGEAEDLVRFPFFFGSSCFLRSDFDTRMIVRIASVNRANSGSLGGVFMWIMIRLWRFRVVSFSDPCSDREVVVWPRWFMAAAYRVVVAERQDLIIVTVVCEECASEVSINSETANVPIACSSCGREFGENAKTALIAYSRFQRTARTAETQAGKAIFRFSIKQTD